MAFTAFYFVNVHDLAPFVIYRDCNSIAESEDIVQSEAGGTVLLDSYILSLASKWLMCTKN